MFKGRLLVFMFTFFMITLSAQGAPRCASVFKDTESLTAALEYSEHANWIFNAWQIVFEHNSPKYAFTVLKVFLNSEGGIKGEIDQKFFLHEAARLGGFEANTARRYMTDYLRIGIMKRITERDPSSGRLRKVLVLTELGQEKYIEVASSIIEQSE